ncbi:hypothetical protein KM043_018060 [Ampulex compressa]|nr:hypothetical protein KM043_018060 [Ampulex compressa]
MTRERPTMVRIPLSFRGSTAIIERTATNRGTVPLRIKIPSPSITEEAKPIVSRAHAEVSVDGNCARTDRHNDTSIITVRVLTGMMTRDMSCGKPRSCMLVLRIPSVHYGKQIFIGKTND